MNRTWAIAIVIVHLVVTTPHSIAHTSLQIEMLLWQNIFIGVVIILAPIVAAVLVWRRKQLGFVLLALSMAGSLLFGVYYHFSAAGADNVSSHMGHEWGSTFMITAVLLAIVELVGTVIGVSGIRRPV